MNQRWLGLLILGLTVAAGCAPKAAESTPDDGSRPPAPQPEFGTIRGTVRYTGKVPPPRKITTTDGSTIEQSDLVVEPKSKGLRDVVALLDNVPAPPPAKKLDPVVIDQRDMIFVPRVVALRQGQAARFENSDLCNHSVMAASILAANQFNIFVSPNQPYEYVFAAQKSPVLIGCSLHGWMRAWVYVVPHPWFAVSDAQGRFEIPQVPPGRYTVWLRHADTGLQERRPLEIAGGQTVPVDVEWQQPAP